MPSGGAGGGGAGQVEEGEQVGPEGVVAVAEVGVAGAEQGVGDAVEAGVAGAAEQGDVVAAAAGGEAGAFGEVGAGDQGGDEGGDFGGVGGAVGVEHDDDVAGGGGEAAGHGVAFAFAGLGEGSYPRQGAACCADRVVGRVPVDHDDLVHGGAYRGDRGEHDLEVARLVAGRHHHGHPWFAAALHRRAPPHRHLGAR